MMLPGTMKFYRVDAPAGSGAVRLKFAAATGSFASNLHPQLSVYRLPN